MTPPPCGRLLALSGAVLSALLWSPPLPPLGGRLSSANSYYRKWGTPTGHPPTETPGEQMKQDNGATDVTIGGTGAGTDGLPAGITADAIRDAEAIFDGLAPASRRAYAGHVRRFAAFAEARGLQGPDALRGRVLADYVRALHSAGSSPATVRQAAAAVRKLATALDRPIQGKAGALVLAAIQSASRDGRDRGRGSAAAADWARAEAAAILAASSRDVSGLRDAALVRVASDCLLRVGEVSALRVGDVSKNRDGSGAGRRPLFEDGSGRGRGNPVRRSADRPRRPRLSPRRRSLRRLRRAAFPQHPGPLRRSLTLRPERPGRYLPPPSERRSGGPRFRSLAPPRIRRRAR